MPWKDCATEQLGCFISYVGIVFPIFEVYFIYETFHPKVTTFDMLSLTTSYRISCLWALLVPLHLHWVSVNFPVILVFLFVF